MHAIAPRSRRTPRTTLMLLAGISVALVSSSLPAQETPDNRLADLAWLVGGTWTAPYATQTARDNESIVVRYRWGSHRQSISYEIERCSDGESTPTHEGFCYWDPEDETFRLVEVDEKGNVTQGTLAVHEDHVSINEVLTMVNGHSEVLRAELRPDGEDAFRFTGWYRHGAEWVQAIQFDYRRTRSDTDEPAESSESLDDGIYPVADEGASDTRLLLTTPLRDQPDSAPTPLRVSATPVMRFEEIEELGFTFTDGECTKVEFANTDALRDYTENHVGGQLAIVINNRVITHHKIRESIQSEMVQITFCTDGGGDHLREYMLERQYRLDVQRGDDDRERR